MQKEPKRVTCCVGDDGTGFDAAATLGGGPKRGMGLAAMRERVCALGGHLIVRSAMDRGTELTVEIPLGDGEVRPLSFTTFPRR